AGRLAAVGAAGLAPAIAQLREPRGVAEDDLAASRLVLHEHLTERARIARIARHEEPQQTAPRAARPLHGHPRDPQRREQRIVGGGDRGFEAAIEAAAAAAAA